MLSKERLILSDILFEYEEKFGLFDERTRAIRKAYIILVQQEETNTN